MLISNPSMPSVLDSLHVDDLALNTSGLLSTVLATTEQVNRLKLIKHSMYGRAKFDLLRQRVLHAA